ncbi:MAG: OmpH family outer membrane protein [Bacteroidota bacterium]|nr:MAG: OmpH family outer membrane protein [Bacteroidota bacterium]
MKKAPIILNVVLILSVAVLYFLHFSTGKSQNHKIALSDSTMAASNGSGGIVYINIDSVLANYNMYKDVMADLQNTLSTKDAELQTKQRKFEASVNDYQNKANKGLVTRSEAASIEQNLQAEQQSLMQLQQTMQYELAEKEQVAQRKVLNSIMEYLKSLESEQHFQFVLGTTFGGNVLYANDQLNITEAVITGLNAEYAATLEK